ncbi:MAG TPA: TolC family protein, partial [Candidatus Methylacidiphilales bacterium]|nr:TolC family protein [Candidatus Methylacidiphilales bacterium]
YGDYEGTSRSQQGTWNANIAVDIPIFTGGQRELDVANSRNLIDQARLDYDDRAKNIQQEVKDAWLNVRTIEAYLRSLQVQVEAADQAYLDIQNQYKAGTSTSIEVLASLNSLNVVRRDLAAKSYDYEIALRKIDEVIGVFQEERVQKLNMK